ncbi:histidine phosphatase family protein [Pseudodesulfovibrio senegalensis]|uniref:Histidine phosphatase family protein n=1 Tax=Pseudodesulfovibrio senegalensis TaxID=1721087 RepID=A0A6N6MY43_9BACT|nr:histidine phosphatase family protein [Pseudodesulfovibrio senegalensis]KAB1439124.1 histidine phosphatase family protein [Pseudodesulfovibrio senegalensis]
MTDTFLTLIRHARTEWNILRRIQGQTDIPLAPQGGVMARQWGNALVDKGYDRILCSDLSRAYRTAEIINEILGLPLEVDPRLREQNWGDWTGLAVDDLRAMREQVAEQEALGFGFCPPGGESRAEVLERSRAALQASATRNPGQYTLVVTHNGVLRALAYDLMGMQYTPDEKSPISKDYRRHELLCREATLNAFKLDMEF